MKFALSALAVFAAVASATAGGNCLTPGASFAPAGYAQTQFAPASTGGCYVAGTASFQAAMTYAAPVQLAPAKQFAPVQRAPVYYTPPTQFVPVQAAPVFVPSVPVYAGQAGFAPAGRFRGGFGRPQFGQAGGFGGGGVITAVFNGVTKLANSPAGSFFLGAQAARGRFPF